VKLDDRDRRVAEAIRRAGTVLRTPRWVDDLAAELALAPDVVDRAITDLADAGYLVEQPVDRPADDLTGARASVVRLTLQGDEALGAGP
jgi:hypothetical protein